MTLTHPRIPSSNSDGRSADPRVPRDPTRSGPRTLQHRPVPRTLLLPRPSPAGLTRRPDSDAGRPLADPGRVRRLGLAGAVPESGAAARGESHPGPAAAASPSSGGPRSALGARLSGGSDPWLVTAGPRGPEPSGKDTCGHFRTVHDVMRLPGAGQAQLDRR